MDRPELEALFREWQQAIGLRDWNLVLRIESREELGGRHGLFRVVESHLPQNRPSVCPPKNCALIRLQDPTTPPNPAEIEPYDPELAVVHELLHCKFWTYRGDQGSIEDLIQEQVIHSFSKLLISQKRRIRALELQLSRKKRKSQHAPD